MGTEREPMFDELPRLAGSGYRHSWDVWGPGDQLGTLNRLTPQVVAAAAGSVRSGERIGVSLPLDEPSPPFFGRKAMAHRFYRMDAEVGWDDWLDGFYLQCSSQWDGLRHIRSADGFYGGWHGDPSADPGPLGIQHWARPGIIGRGVLVDLAAGEIASDTEEGAAGEEYDPFTARRFTAADIEAALAAQGVGIRTGDILCVRTGWMDKYLTLGEQARAELAVALANPRDYTCAGLSGSEEISRFLWDSGVAAVAADNPAVETVPADPSIGFLHGRLIPSLGFAIGELFDFSALAAACHADRRYDFLFTSVPLNVTGGVGSPANAVAVR
jgi:kynurenine formamidase